MSKTSFIHSDNRHYNVYRALSLIKSDIVSGLRNAKSIVVKPNCVVTDFQLAATHKDAIRAVFDFISPYAKCQITLAEGSGIGETLDAFKNYGYFDLQDEYGFAIVDLNRDEYTIVPLIDRKHKVWQAQVAKTISEADYLISVTPPKTHNETLYTGAIKNVAVGSLLRPEGGFAAKIANKVGIVRNNKAMIHQGQNALHKNISHLAKRLPINLAVIDGYSSMQGDGPSHNGELAATQWAIASSDALIADLTAIQLMGINPENVGYIKMLVDEHHPEEDFIAGDNWQEHISSLKMPSNFDKIIHFE